jgi:uncharacterized protein YxjI
VDVTIEQRKFNFRYEYDIYAPDQRYFARKRLFSLHDKFQLYKTAGHVVARIESHFFLFRPRYDFHLPNGKSYRFRCEKLWKRTFVCEGESETFRLYEHKGLKYSVFRNNIQIAAFTKNRLKIGRGTATKFGWIQALACW